jgi:hypothetical protein
MYERIRADGIAHGQAMNFASALSDGIGPRLTGSPNTVDHLHAADLEQAAIVEAIFLWNTSEREAMMPRKPFPHPEYDQKMNAPIPGLFPNTASGKHQEQAEAVGEDTALVHRIHWSFEYSRGVTPTIRLNVLMKAVTLL